MTTCADTPTPATLFVTDPYVLGTTRTHNFDVFSEDENGQKSREDLTGDRILVIVKKDFDQPEVAPIITFSSARSEISLSTTVKSRFTLTIPHTCTLPVGELQYRGIRIVNPDQPSEIRDPLWTEKFVARA
jgi:hypothetical protein